VPKERLRKKEGGIISRSMIHTNETHLLFHALLAIGGLVSHFESWKPFIPFLSSLSPLLPSRSINSIGIFESTS
jgi:hypothetical protein